MTIQDLIKAFADILKQLLPLSVGIALLYFFWGLSKFIWNSGDTKKVGEGRAIMTWGIIALFVMTSIWGIINILSKDLLGVGTTTATAP